MANYTYGYIYHKGVEIGSFSYRNGQYGEDVVYSLNSNEDAIYSMTFTAFDTMCEALEYDLRVIGA